MSIVRLKKLTILCLGCTLRSERDDPGGDSEDIGDEEDWMPKGIPRIKPVEHSLNR